MQLYFELRKGGGRREKRGGMCWWVVRVEKLKCTVATTAEGMRVGGGYPDHRCPLA